MLLAPHRPASESVDPTAPHFLERLVTGTLLTLAIGLAASLPAHSAETATAAKSPHSAPPNSAAIAQNLSALPNGTYLFGQSAQPNQIGSAYLVVNVRDRDLVGAFYMPSSSFDCFRGTLQSHQLALSVTNSDDQTSHPFAIPLQTKALVAAGKPQSAPLELVGYHRISTLSESDRHLLATCQANSFAPGEMP